jgi:hypothetical protein
MMRLLRFLGVSAAIAGAGCQTDRIAGPAPRHGPGALDARLTTPNSDDGALLVELHGGPIDSITSTRYEVAALQSDSGEYRVLVRGAIDGGALLRVWVPERSDRTAYVMSVLDAVGRVNYDRRDVTKYAVNVGAER